MITSKNGQVSHIQKPRGLAQDRNKWRKTTRRCADVVANRQQLTAAARYMMPNKLNLDIKFRGIRPILICSGYVDFVRGQYFLNLSLYLSLFLSLSLTISLSLSLCLPYLTLTLSHSLPLPLPSSPLTLSFSLLLPLSISLFVMYTFLIVLWHFCRLC